MLVIKIFKKLITMETMKPKILMCYCNINLLIQKRIDHFQS